LFKFLKSSFGTNSSGLSLFKISIKSVKLFIQTISIQGIIDASSEFSSGKNILLNHFSFAQIVLGRAPEIFLSFQSRDNSQTKILSLK
jgi:hypothetical protein